MAHCPFEAPKSGPVYPVLHEQSVVDVPLRGLLLSAQQSSNVLLEDSALNPAGHAWHPTDPLAF
jgi:hypothetical protein